MVGIAQLMSVNKLRPMLINLKQIITIKRLGVPHTINNNTLHVHVCVVDFLNLVLVLIICIVHFQNSTLRSSYSFFLGYVDI